MMEEESESSSAVTLRHYQELIANQAVEFNTIAYLPTGAGKTYIAFHVIDCRLQYIRKAREQPEEWPKVAIFIAPTRALLSQQIDSIKKFCKNVKAEEFNGGSFLHNKHIDTWGREEWMNRFQGLEVFGMTPAILRNLLQKQLLPSNVIDLIVFDECHHATGNEEMGRLCDTLRMNNMKPLILGLTASPIKCKGADIRGAIEALEERMMSSFFLPTESFLSSLLEFAAKPASFIVEYEEMTSYESLAAMDIILGRMIMAEHLELIFDADAQLQTDLYLMMCDNLGIPVEPLKRHKGLNGLRQCLNQCMEILKECGLYCGIQCLLIYFQEDAEGTSDRPFAGKKQQFNSCDAYGSGKTSHKLDKTLCKQRAGEVLAYINNDAALFLELRNQRSLFFVSLQRFLLLIISFLTHEMQAFLAVEVSNDAKDILNGSLLELLLDGNEDELLKLGAAFQKGTVSICEYILVSISVQEVAHLSPMPTLSTTNYNFTPKVHRLMKMLHGFMVGEAPLPAANMEMIQIHVEDRSLELHTFEQVLSKQQVQSDRSVLVFCNLRVVSVALSVLFNAIYRQSEFQYVAAYLHGECSILDQRNVLGDFKAGKIHILFATEVAEEGLDVKRCSALINFTPPQTVKSMIQRRGRARAESSQIFNLWPARPSAGHDKCCDDLHLFLDEEEEMNESFQRYIRTIGILAADSIYRYQVPSTGAYVDMISAQAILLEYSEILRGMTEEVTSPIMYTFEGFEDPIMKSPSFACSLRLPIRDHPKLKSIAASKSKAKGLVAIEAVKYLHQRGDLDDHLRIVATLRTTTVTEKGTPKRKRTPDCPTPIDAENIPEDLTTLKLKLTADILTQQPFRPQPQQTYLLYTYRVVAEYSGNMDLVINGKYSNRLKAINRMGFALPVKLNIDDLESTLHHGFLKDADDLKLSYHFIESREVDEEELALMQAFHRSVMCLEVPELGFDLSSKSQGFVLWNQVHRIQYQKAMCRKYIDFDEWKQSGKGAWFVCFPLHPERKQFDRLYTEQAVKESIALLHNLDLLRLNSYNGSPKLDWHVADLPPDLEEYVVTSSGKNIFRFLHRGVECPMDYSIDLSEKINSSKKSKTYSEYFSSTELRKEIIDNSSSSLRLYPAYQLSGKLTLLNPWTILCEVGELERSASNDKNDRLEPWRDYPHLVPEFSVPIGKLQWFNMMLLYPAVAHRFQALLLADELRVKVFAPNRLFGYPSLNLMLEAVTNTRCVENFKQERLEFLGDTFLKMAASAHVFLSHPGHDEGMLTNARTRIISNANLIEKARSFDLTKYIRSIPVSKGLEELLYSPPGYLEGKRSLRNVNVQRVAPEFRVAIAAANIPAKIPMEVAAAEDGVEIPCVKIASESRMEEILAEDHMEITAVTPAKPSQTETVGCFPMVIPSEVDGTDAGILGAMIVDEFATTIEAFDDLPKIAGDGCQIAHGIRNKVQSDLLEALLGAAYVTGGVELGIRTMPRLGIFPEEVDLNWIKQQAANYITIVEEALSKPHVLTLTQEKLQQLEAKLHYSFQHPLILSLALRHFSLQQAGESWSFQRLEFLGDAVLDLCIVKRLFEAHPDWQEGRLTEGKISFANNEYVKSQAMKLELIEFVLHSSLTVSNLRDSLRAVMDPSYALSLTSNASHAGESGKICADIFEAIVGAIWLDSGCDFARLFEFLESINYFST